MSSLKLAGKPLCRILSPHACIYAHHIASHRSIHSTVRVRRICKFHLNSCLFLFYMACESSIGVRIQSLSFRSIAYKTQSQYPPPSSIFNSVETDRLLIDQREVLLQVLTERSQWHLCVYTFHIQSCFAYIVLVFFFPEGKEHITISFQIITCLFNFFSRNCLPIHGCEIYGVYDRSIKVWFSEKK